MKVNKIIDNFLKWRIGVYEGRYIYASKDKVKERLDLEFNAHKSAERLDCDKIYRRLAVKYKLMNPKKILGIAIERRDRAVVKG